MEESYTLKLDPRSEKYLTMYLLTDIKNMINIRKKILSGELNCCILKASMIVDPFQVVVAVNKAVLREKFNCLITKSLSTEILYCISSSTNISLSLAKFGIHDNDKNIILAIIHDENNKNQLTKEILPQIDGKITSISELKKYSDVKLIRKTYKIDNNELKVSSLEDSIVSRIGADYPVSLK